jgi:hypothetical protein
LTARSIGGSGHLLRPRISCARKANHAAKAQSVLNYSSDGSVRSWDYNPETARIELCHLIARLDLPLGIGAYDAFVEYIRRAHNPRYAPICRQTIYDTTYPVLSILAKEVMTMSILTISSEFTFSLVGRVIEERRRSLTSNMVEMISCLKD